MKNILIITENYNIGGLETNIKTTSEFLVKKGFKLFLISSKHSSTDNIDYLLSGKMVIDSFNSLNGENLKESIDIIASFILENKIDFTIIHPFRSFIHGSIACVKTKTPYSIFIHGPVNISVGNGYNYILLLKHFVFKYASTIFCVSEELKDLLKNDFNVNANVFLNPIDTDIYSRTNKYEKNGDFLFIGRLDNDKAQGLKEAIQFIDSLKRKNGDKRELSIIGDGNARNEIENWINNNLIEKDWIKIKGYSNNVNQEIENASLVFGMARVVLEACSMCTPIVLTGYDGLKGVITKDLFEAASYSNFSGRGLKNQNYDEIMNDLMIFNESTDELNTLKNLVLSHYNIQSISESFINYIINSKFDFSDIGIVNQLELGLKNSTDFYSTDTLSILLSIFENATGLSPSETELQEIITKFTKNIELVQAENNLLKEKYDQALNENKLLKEEYEKKINDYQNLFSGLKKEYEESEKQFGDQLKSSNNIISKLEQNLTTANNELTKIYSSNLWKFARVYYNIRNSIKIKDNQIQLKELVNHSDHNETITKQQENNQTNLNKLDEIIKNNPSKGIILFPPLVDWNIPLFQRPQHIAMSLGKEGYIYIYCTLNYLDNVNGFEEVSKSCFVTNISDQDIIKELDKYTDKEKIIHLYSTDNIRGIDYIKTVKKKGFKIIYEYVDEIHEEISGHKIPVETLNKHNYILKDESITVIATADKLYEDVQKVRKDNFALITNGVQRGHFERKYDEIPSDIRELVGSNKPVIGYFGAFAKWFDYELVEKIANRHPEWELLLIGKDYDGSIRDTNFSQFNNINVIGPINYKDLPRYAQYFTVSTIPFLINDITESTSPIKLFEYMALEKPIVTTAMPECRKYESVFVGENHEDFIGKLEIAVKGDLPSDYYNKMCEEYLDNTWDQKAKDIISLFKI